MSDIRKVLDAMAALVRSTSASYVTVNRYDEQRIGISLAHNTDDAARTTATSLGIKLRLVGNETTEWLAGDGLRVSDDLTVTVYGPHHERCRPSGSDAVESALAKAQEALRPGSPFAGIGGE